MRKNTITNDIKERFKRIFASLVQTAASYRSFESIKMFKVTISSYMRVERVLWELYHSIFKYEMKFLLSSLEGFWLRSFSSKLAAILRESTVIIIMLSGISIRLDKFSQSELKDRSKHKTWRTNWDWTRNTLFPFIFH